MEQIVLSMQGVYIRLENRLVLENINLQIKTKEILTVVGPNASGKTTLLRSIMRAIPIEKGRIQHPQQIGYIPQNLHLDYSMPLTVSRFLRMPRQHTIQKMQDALKTAGTENLLNAQMQELSGGHFQRVLLARALLEQPSLLLLDEPTRSLDPPGINSFYQLIASLRDQTGCAILMVSHDLHVVMSASDRIICLNKHICCEGTPENVSSTPEYNALFGQNSTLALYKHTHDHQHNGNTPAS